MGRTIRVNNQFFWLWCLLIWVMGLSLIVCMINCFGMFDWRILYILLIGNKIPKYGWTMRNILMIQVGNSRWAFIEYDNLAATTMQTYTLKGSLCNRYLRHDLVWYVAAGYGKLAMGKLYLFCRKVSKDSHCWLVGQCMKQT